MFTEGLDPHALRWVREQRIGLRGGNAAAGVGGGGGLGIPPPEKFRSGFLPRSAVPVSRAVPLEDSGSDLDDSDDTEGYVYGGRYSLDSSPQDDAPARKLPPATGVGGGGYRYMQNQYSSDTYSEFSSSRETVLRQQQQRSQGGVNDYVEGEGESSDSPGSSGYMQQPGRGNGGAGLPPGRCRPAESYSREDAHIAAEEDCHSNVPSAPPFHGSHEEVGQATNEHEASRVSGTPCKAGSNSYSIKKEASAHGNAQRNTAKQNVSTSAGAEAAIVSGSLPLRVPTFHASGQGPWYSVIAYDACVRLCLHSWARGCMEAPMFLENECALLRNAFGFMGIYSNFISSISTGQVSM